MWNIIAHFIFTCFGSVYTKIGTIQRLARPLHKDDTQNCEAFTLLNKCGKQKIYQLSTKYVKENCKIKRVALIGLFLGAMGSIPILCFL